MATVNPTVRWLGNDAVLFTWVLTNVDNDGAPVGPGQVNFADRTVQVFGTFGGATALIQGSNEPSAPSVWFTVDNPTGGDLSFTAAEGKSLRELPVWTRPLLSGGAGSSVTVALTARRSRR